MLKLAAVFENAAGRTHRWSFNEPDPNKSPEEIQAALETITTLNLFEKDGIRQFTKVVSAKFVETIETPIFDLSQPAPEAYVADASNLFSAYIVSDEAEETAAPAVETVKPLEKKAAAVPEPLAASVATPALPIENAASRQVSNASTQQLEALATETKKSEAEESSIPKPINPRKAQVDRVRAFHQAKKKKGKKNKR